MRERALLVGVITALTVVAAVAYVVTTEKTYEATADVLVSPIPADDPTLPALGLVMCWGKAGILSLGQGVFFGLGGYSMAMFLKLEASDPISTKIQSTPGIPDFMDWNQITELPFFWIPFKSLPFTLLAVIVVPSIAAFILGAAMFKRRVGGVSEPRTRRDRDVGCGYP
jgi:ABC-type branched-subunit amino acid transport system permease subunit